jgi:hypothetical protein
VSKILDPPLYFNGKLGIEDTVKPTIGNESLFENNSDKGLKDYQLFHIKEKHSSLFLDVS